MCDLRPEEPHQDSEQEPPGALIKILNSLCKTGFLETTRKSFEEWGQPLGLNDQSDAVMCESRQHILNLQLGTLIPVNIMNRTRGLYITLKVILAII